MWPRGAEVFKALASMPRSAMIDKFLSLDLLTLTTDSLINDVVAYAMVDAANDIPDPRLTHRGPWTPGWTPLPTPPL